MRDMAHQQRVEPLRYRSARRQRVVRAGESDRFISKRRKHFFIGEQPLVCIINHQHRLPAAESEGGCFITRRRRAFPNAGQPNLEAAADPGALQTFIAPPCSRTISRTVASPKPLPARRVVKNGSKMCSRVVPAMPRPVSHTAVRT